MYSKFGLKYTTHVLQLHLFIQGGSHYVLGYNYSLTWCYPAARARALVEISKFY